jgi:hypothetical protein
MSRLNELFDIAKQFADLYVEDIGYDESDPDEGMLMVCGLFQITVGMMRKVRNVVANEKSTKEELLEALRPFAKLPESNKEYDIEARVDGFILTTKMLDDAKRIYEKYA